MEPKIIEDTIKMLLALSEAAEKLVGDKPCVRSMVYMHAAELMSQIDQPIQEHMNGINRFLVRDLHKIDR